MPSNSNFAAFLHSLNEHGISYKENEALSAHSTFRIGGPARVFVIPRSRGELCDTLSLADESEIRLFVAGRGSNVVYSDNGFDGAVISTSEISSYEFDGNSVTADAGVPVTELAVAAAKKGLGGLEFAYGIPGSLGGAVFMNAGAYGGEMKDIVVSSAYYDRNTGTLGELVGDENEFDYRHSAYKTSPSRVILGATARLTLGDRESIEAVMRDYMARRIEKQPLELPSAGSSFKRCTGRYTGEMIDKAGLRGLTVGGAQVSEKHAGFIVNIGGATCEDVRRLSDIVKERVFEFHGVRIENEIIFVE